MGSDLRRTVLRLPHHDASDDNVGLSENYRRHLREQLGSEILDRGIVPEQVQLLTGEQSARGDGSVIVLPEDHAVIPVFIDPSAEARLEHREVDHPADRVERRARSDVEERDVIVAVQVGAFRFVSEYAMTGTEGHTPYDFPPPMS
jgi:hypothetical protein